MVPFLAYVAYSVTRAGNRGLFAKPEAGDDLGLGDGAESPFNVELEPWPPSTSMAKSRSLLSTTELAAPTIAYTTGTTSEYQHLPEHDDQLTSLSELRGKRAHSLAPSRGIISRTNSFDTVTNPASSTVDGNEVTKPQVKRRRQRATEAEACWKKYWA
ncbi:uncharacterized protein BCR38DRAFT_483080 [Pseudomassariella vexata]|uniref:Uncharacterized protein n=1 Tax=Pseudomassariella vexata TaxID=1141098 RepID=A0A1Y2E9C8_9PEZI|nr:uncharacterized protein BCR38DRAFT_483080 [Pseudomassariella vexata]ORY67465.1 hypothetical protein BCR38DRAFT_483080 [Pseudomassariella vexata]